jgi:membrane protein DedA with SNARE-associated domain
MVQFPSFAFSTFQGALSFVEASSYIMIFIAMVIEGPIVTAAAAFAASLGYLNIITIFFLSLFGDLLGDILHYGAGRMLHRSFIEKYSYKIGIKRKTIERMEKHMRNNLGKTMLLVKFTPILTLVGLLLTGALRVPFRKFMKVSLLVTLPRTIFFTCLGYFFGVAVSRIMRYFNLGSYILPFIALVALIAYFAYRKFSQKITEKI